MARVEGRNVRSTTPEFMKFLSTGPNDPPPSSDQPVQPSAFAVLAPKGKKNITIEDVASLGLGWRHSDRVLASTFDHRTEITATERFTKPSAAPRGEPERPETAVTGGSLRLRSGLDTSKPLFAKLHRSK